LKVSANAYPLYREVGVSWLDAIPEGWTFQPLRNITSFTTGWTPPTADAASYDGEHLWANISDLGSKRISNTAKRLSAQAIEANRIQVSPKGSLLFSFKLTIGSVSIVDTEMYTNEAIATFRPSAHLLIAFAYYALPLCIVKNAGENIYGAPMLNARHMRSARIVVPPIVDQQQIADYLDAQTTKIDLLIGKQQRLIERLAERRQAVISHAVTNGLDPHAPMKESGVSWFGSVPSAWTVTPVKRMTVLITDGAHISPELEGGQYDFVSTRDVSDEGINFEGSLKTSPESYDYLVRTGCQPHLGDVLFSKDGTIGRTVVVRESRNFVVASSLIIIRPDASRVVSEFLDYQCKSVQLQEQVRSFVKGAGLPRISIANLLKIVGVFPDVSEQIAIVEYLDRETAQMDALTAKAREMIEVLKERRQALISAAVTGKIDVRGLS